MPEEALKTQETREQGTDAKGPSKAARIIWQKDADKPLSPAQIKEIQRIYDHFGERMPAPLKAALRLDIESVPDKGAQRVTVVAPATADATALKAFYTAFRDSGMPVELEFEMTGNKPSVDGDFDCA